MYEARARAYRVVYITALAAAVAACGQTPKETPTPSDAPGLSGAQRAPSAQSLAGPATSTPLLASAAVSAVADEPAIASAPSTSLIEWLKKQQALPQFGTSNATCRESGWCTGRCNGFALPTDATCEVRYFRNDLANAAVAIELPGDLDCGILGAHGAPVDPRGKMSKCDALPSPLTKLEATTWPRSGSTLSGHATSFLIVSTAGFRANQTAIEFR